VTCAEVAPGILLDPRRALVAADGAWMAIADLHIGYEIARAAGGGLFPQWGQTEVESALLGLLADHQPKRLLLVGDITDRGIRESDELAIALLDRVEPEVSELVLIKGNHDRRMLGQRRLVDHFSIDQYLFHHGHEFSARAELAVPETIHVSGHSHPALHLRDGAGLSVKLPAFLQDSPPVSCPGIASWVLPAFSPWAAGGQPRKNNGTTAKLWGCLPDRILPPQR